MFSGHGGAKTADHLVDPGTRPDLRYLVTNGRPAHGSYRGGGNPCATCSRRAGRPVYCNQLRGMGTVERARNKVRELTKLPMPGDNGSVTPGPRDVGREWLPGLVRIFAAPGNDGSGYYRVRLPLQGLRAHGHEVTLKSSTDVIGFGDYAGSDVCVVRSVNLGHLLQLRRVAGRVVYDLDDDVFSVLPDNKAAFAYYGRSDVREAVRQCVSAADLVTVTGEHLASVVRRYNPHAVVLPNRIPSVAVDLPLGESPRRSVGWAGGPSHVRDVQLVVSPVARFLKRFPAWSLRLMGADYRSQFKCHASFAPAIDINEDPRGYFTALDFGIGLAPLRDNHFNRSKSPLKAMEYAARGIPVIASDVEPYRSFVRHGVTGFLARYEHEWLSYLSELASDDKLREGMGAAARDVALEWTMDRGWQAWERAYSSKTVQNAPVRLKPRARSAGCATPLVTLMYRGTPEDGRQARAA